MSVKNEFDISLIFEQKNDRQFFAKGWTTEHTVQSKNNILIAEYSKNYMNKEYFVVPTEELLKWVKSQNFNIVNKDFAI